MHYQPVVANLAVGIGNPHDQVHRLTFRIGPADMLDRVAVTECAIGHDMEIGDLELQRSLERGEESSQSLRYALAPTYCRGGTTSNTTKLSSGT